MTPDLVLFDLGDVLARWDNSPRTRAFAGRAGITVDEVRRRMRDSGYGDDCDRGVYTADEMHARHEELLGCRFERAELHRLEALTFTLRPGVIRIASALRERLAPSARLGILTNNGPLLEESFPEHFPELHTGFDPIFFSHRFGEMKPAVSLFRRVAERAGVAPGRILFVDDQQRHVDGARAAGWNAVRFQDEDSLTDLLEGAMEATP